MPNIPLCDLPESVAWSRFAALGEMAANIAHEISGPLTTIQLLNSQIAEEAAKSPPDSRRIAKMASSITCALDHVAKIVQGIRFVSRDGRNDPASMAKIKDLLENTLRLCQGKIKKLDIHVELSVVPESLEIACRVTHISQVLLNLICNACDAIEPLGERWVQIDAGESGAHVMIRVTDSGSGIPREIQERIFDPFFTTKGPEKGTGIGLSISRKIMENHQGRLFLDPDSGNTRFVLQIPITSA